MDVAPKYTVFLAVVSVTLVLDQGSKGLVNRYLGDRDEISVIPAFLSFVHRENPAAMMGLMADVEGRLVLFFVFTLISSAVIGFLLWQIDPRDRFVAGVLGLTLGGAYGNQIDRIVKGSVTDFIKVYTELPSLVAWLRAHVGTSEWPTFNIADSALVIGILLFLTQYLFAADRESLPAAADGERTPE